MWNGWGNDAANTRFQNEKAAGLSAAEVPKLTLKWAFGFRRRHFRVGAAHRRRRAASSSATPTAWSTRSTLKTGCTHWSFKADGGVRTAISIARVAVGGAPRTMAMFGDIRANAYAVDAQTGELVWKTKVDDHAFARVTGAPAFANGRLYVPVSSIEEVAGGTSELSMLHVPRQRRRARRGHRQRDLEDLHDCRGAEDHRQELDGHSALETGRRRDLDLADPRHGEQHHLRRNRQRLHRAGGADQRCGGGAGHENRRHPVGAAGDAKRRLRDWLQARRRELSR